MTNYAVLIGNSEFPREPSLNTLTCPAFDVDGLAKVLTIENRGQFSAENISVLKNKPHYEVIEEITIALKKAGKDDLVLLYYSGHGLPNNKNSLYLSTINTKAELLEATAVSFNQIYDLINTFYCKKIVIILDCCYSGAAGNVFKGDIASQLQTLNNKVTGTFLITASSNDQVAQEKSKGNYSLFTSHLIDGLETGEADKDGDGFISIDELFRYVYKKVVSENPSQVPKRFLKNETGELIIAKSGRDSRKEQVKKIEGYFFDLAKDKRIAHDMLSDVLTIINKPVKELSALEKEKNNLIGEVFENQDAVEFIRKWEKLAIEIKPNNLKAKITIFILIIFFIALSYFFANSLQNYSDEKNKKPPENIAEDNQKQLEIEAENKKALADEAEKQKQLAIAAENQKQAELAAEKERQLAEQKADAKAAQEAEAAKAKAAQQAVEAKKQQIETAKNSLKSSDKTRWANAVKVLKNAENLDAEAMLLLGGGLYRMKSYSQACDWFKKAADAGNQDAAGYLKTLKKCR